MDWWRLAYLCAFGLFILLAVLFAAWLLRTGRREVEWMTDTDKDSDAEG